MQRPTLQNTRIRSTRDALQVFYAVARNVLPLITRRLDAEERRAITPGNVYVWEERGANTEATGLGMERWTDGMGWGPSRVRDEFLFYHQKEFDMGDDAINPITPWSQMIRVYPSAHSRGGDTERLIKQTYSVHVFLPSDRPHGITRKWHLTAYFSQSKLDTLQTVDTIRGVGDTTVPEGWFRSARANKARKDNREISGLPVSPTGDANIDTSEHSDSSISHPMPSHTQRSHPPSDASSRRYTGAPPRMDTSRSVSSSPPGGLSQVAPGGHLVPLEYLQSISYPRRDPTDEQLLRKFTMQSIVSGGSPATYPRNP